MTDAHVKQAENSGKNVAPAKPAGAAELTPEESKEVAEDFSLADSFSSNAVSPHATGVDNKKSRKHGE